MNVADAIPYLRCRRNAWLAGTVGIVVCIVALFFARPRVFQAYWIAWIFWSGIGFGSLVILMIHALTGGAWGEAIRAPAEAAAMTLPLMALLFIPALFGIHDIFAWAQPATFSGHDWPHKRAYLSTSWFAIRGLGCFAILGGWTILLGLWSRRENGRTRFLPDANPVSISAAGLLIYSALMIFASTDWLMSLEPAWSSTMLAVIFMIDQFLTALAFTVCVAICLAPLTTKQLHDLGNLLLASVMLWAYVTFSQFLIIWSGNLPREISWYLHRGSGGWPRVAIALAVFQFAVPFLLLLSRAAKRHARTLRPIAALIFVANAMHIWWLIAPSFPPAGIHFPFLGLAAFIGIGGIWTAVFLGFLKKRASLSSPAPEVPTHA